MHSKWIQIVAIGYILISATTSCSSETRVVWSEKQGTSFDLFETTLINGTWSAPVCVVTSKKDDITPAVTEDHDGNVWLVWISVDEFGHSQPCFQVTKSGRIILSGTIPSEFAHNYSPSVLVDRENTIWACWSSSDGTSEQIYVSRFTDQSWLPTTRVSNGDSQPNIQCLLALGIDGAVQVSWSKLVASGYHTYQSTWQGGKFANTVTNIQANAATNKQRCDSLPPLPAKAKKSSMVTIFQNRIDGVQSVPGWASPCMTKLQP